jgi:hypothetical protein
MCLTSRRPKLDVDTFRASQPANGHGPALISGATGNGAVQATGLEGTATRTINRDLSHSFPCSCDILTAPALPQHVATRARRAGESTTARCNSAWVIGGNQLRFQRAALVLKFPVLRLWSIAYASELDPVDCAERPRPNFLYRRQ